MILEFLNDTEWDHPFFKRLPANDTGSAPGHQGGIVIPKDLRPYFPALDDTLTSEVVPTVDRRLQVELYNGSVFLHKAYPRYQYQTWGGTRPPESRITDNLSELRNRATAGDILVFQRKMELMSYFRFILIKANSPQFESINSFINGRRWGALCSSSVPAEQSEIQQSLSTVISLSKQPFTIFAENIQRAATRQSRIVRCTVFPSIVSVEYGQRCAVSGLQIRTPNGLPEIQAAHVVPIGKGGSDDVRNGIALTHTLHWAFDQGLFGITRERKVFVPDKVRVQSENEYLAAFHEKTISEARTPERRLHPDAAEWHLKNIVEKWS